MNKEQFEIVKLFQKMGADHKRLAKAFCESEMEIVKAYNAENFDKFQDSSDEDYMQDFKTIFGI